MSVAEQSRETETDLTLSSQTVQVVDKNVSDLDVSKSDEGQINTR